MSIPELIDLFALPSVALYDRATLPSVPGIYFVLKDKIVLYIGRTHNLTKRWRNHHQYQQIKDSTSIRIAWLEYSDAGLLPAVEEALINTFQPELNTSVGRKKLDHGDIHVRVASGTPEKLQQLAVAMGYRYGAGGATGELLDAIAKGKLVPIAKETWEQILRLKSLLTSAPN